MMSNHTTQVPNVPYGKVDYDLATEMVVFDALPSQLRRRIASAAVQICVVNVADALHYGMSILEILREIDALEARFLESAYAERGVFHG